jgi:hypothetical protein
MRRLMSFSDPKSSTSEALICKLPLVLLEATVLLLLLLFFFAGEATPWTTPLILSVRNER